MTTVSDLEVADLLGELIRNRCVNDGTDASGGESRSADVLASVLAAPGVELERFEPTPGRASLVARIEGSDPRAPSLCLMGHTDVVPVSGERWRHDPFGGELIEGEVWGRGAVDMLNLTSSMALAVGDLARSGWRPKGTLVYLAVADEEALGSWGAGWLTSNALDAVRTDYVITEPGSVRIPTPSGTRLAVSVAEKGTYWVRLRVFGTPGHGSQPLRSDNALVNAAKVVCRLADYRPEADIHDAWRRWVGGVGLEPALSDSLLDPARIDAALDALPVGMARLAHACTHTTFAPTVAHGGVKTNVIPGRVDIEVDIRTLPGQQGRDVEAMIDDALGDLRSRVEVEVLDHDPASSSPTETPLWDVLAEVGSQLVPGSGLVASMSVGATDARFFRRVGTTAYGFGLFSERIGFDRYQSMFHGDDERVDTESLGLSRALWSEVARRLLS